MIWYDFYPTSFVFSIPEPWRVTRKKKYVYIVLNTVISKQMHITSVDNI
jgi:hypothetical protein